MRAKFDLSTLPKSPNLQYEMELWSQGVHYVAGIDEAGRGALAGPVSAAVVILPHLDTLPQLLSGVRDSKEMTPLQREYWAGQVRSIALAWRVGFASSVEIDQIGIVPATLLAVQRALEQLPLPPEHLLLDYIRLAECSLPQTSLIKGDARSLSIAAASILAKTSRDALLRSFDEVYPSYGFGTHKGYATKAHLEALAQFGPCPEHRTSFQPIRGEADQA